MLSKRKMSSESRASSSSNVDISSPAPTTSTMVDNGYLQEKLNDAQSKFEKACHQIVLLDQKIKDLEVRYKRAVKNRKNSFRYNLRLRLSAVTGVKMMYHHYASTKADELHRLHRQRHAVVRSNAVESTDTSSDPREDV
ncbi:hypothetical protein ACF0H5_021619 [Mactra antiquata]